MANLNLSEFTEKTFVADADWTFVWDTAGLISKKVSRNNWLNSGTLTTSAPVTISQTWNALAVAFTAFKVNATSTNSATGSLLLDLQVGGASKFTVNKGGGIISKANIITADGATGAAGLSLEMVFANYGIGIDSNGNTAFLVNGLAKSRAGFGVAIASDQSLSFTNTTHVGGNATADTILVRDGAANTLALRNGTNAQTFNVYGTYTSGSAYARLAIACDTSGNATLTTQSTGVAGTVSINGVPVGLGKGNVSTNVAVGTSALNGVTTGSQNTAIGYESAIALTSGNGNVSIGFRSLRANTGSQNVAIGADSLQQNTSGANNTSLGYSALNANTTGASNTAVGAAAMLPLNSGSNNTALGNDAGRYDQYGVVWNQTCNQSVFLGAGSKAQSLGQTNQIVIGYDAIGLGSNTAVLGNASITTTALRGNVGIGTTAPSSKLHVASGAINIMQAGTNAGVPYISVGDTAIYGDALDSLELRRPSSAAQTIKLYGTYTASPLAYERLTISAPSSGNAIIGTNKSGTGAVARGLEFQTDGVTRLTIAAGGAMTAGGALTCSQVTVGAGAYLFHGGQVAIGSSGNGKHILFDAGGTFYDRLQIGGTSASFPAIKRVGTDLQIVLASTTAAAGVAAGDADLTFIEDRYRRKGAGSPEGVVTAPIGAVYHRTDGGLMSSFYVKESGTGNTGWVGK